jgi:hypothetical protein
LQVALPCMRRISLCQPGVSPEFGLTFRKMGNFG